MSRDTGGTHNDEGQSQEKGDIIALKYPMLTKSNYAAWAIKMEVYMMAQGVWEAIETEGVVETRKDKMALAVIYQGISEDTLLQLGAKRTAKEAWSMLKTMNLGAEKVKEVRTQSLWREFEAMKMSNEDSVDDYASKLQIVVTKLRGLGNEVKEEKIVKKLLRSASPKFLQIASTIEEFGDLKTKTSEEIIGSLKAHEERFQSVETKTEETVLLTQAEWKAREEKHAKDVSRDFRSNRGGRGRGRGRGYNTSHKREEEPMQKRKFDKSKIKCYNCGKMGHFASECTTEEKEDHANFMKEEDFEEPALLMIETCELNQTQPLQENTHELKRNEASWYLDTGASNHMTGDKGCFTSIDSSVNGKVRFGDGSVIDIHGLGSILFQCKNGEHLVLTNVYYIPKLKSNIISLGQLSENGSRVVIEKGVMRVYDSHSRLIIRVERQNNKLFTVRLQIAEKICLLMNIEDKSWLWHARFGHLNFQALKRLSTFKMVEGLPEISHVNQVCDGCAVGKMHRTTFPNKTSFRAKKALELIHGDLCGPITPSTPAGNKYFLLLVDDYSRYMWITLLASKSEALEKFKRFKALIENEVLVPINMVISLEGGVNRLIGFSNFL
ncbi:unnamed protein product [Cuscuta epithymum]|uniref:CCHC-type domain-containing protein n=1 Tax=Cuscuta epithymum TaxID=186058 RepID=A0AAV0FJB6_9ASTE|nr:unnamed protein product [Cuscuta epithymum]